MNITYCYPEKENGALEFEQTVFEYLLLEQVQFDKYVKKHGGYALLLRNWIKEAYMNGITVNEVVISIKKSNLKIEEITMGNPIL